VSEGKVDIRIDELVKEVTYFVSASEIPDTFEATVTDVQVKEDRYGRKSLYLRVKFDDGKTTVIKYTPLHMVEVVKALAKMKVKTTGELIGRKFRFEKRHFRIGLPRPIPVEVVKE